MAAGLRSAEKRIGTAPSVARPRPVRQSDEILFEPTGVVCKIDLVLPCAPRRSRSKEMAIRN